MTIHEGDEYLKTRIEELHEEEKFENAEEIVGFLERNSESFGVLKLTKREMMQLLKITKRGTFFEATKCEYWSDIEGSGETQYPAYHRLEAFIYDVNNSQWHVWFSRTGAGDWSLHLSHYE